MFDKIYRQAMDNVPLNTGLLADLKKQAKQIDEQKSATVQKPKFNIYRYGFAAAVLVAVVLGANVFSSYMDARNSAFTNKDSYIKTTETAAENNTETQPEQSTADAQNYTYSAVPETNAKTGQKPALKPQEKQQTLPTGNTVGETAIDEETKPEILQQTEIVADMATPAAGEISETGEDSTQPAENTAAVLNDINTKEAVFSTETETAMAADMPAAETTSESETAEETTDVTEAAAASGGGGAGGGSGAKIMTEENTLRETWSTDEFCTYFEIDILSLALPPEMKNTVSGNAYVEKDETGSILGGQCSVYYAADGKSVAMTIYSDGDYVNAVAVGEQTPSGASVVRYENGAFTVYAYPGGRGCVAEIFGFSEEELTAFVSSLK